MTDWPMVAIVGTSGAFTLLGGALGWATKHAYDRGRKDGAAKSADLSAAAAIGRIEIAFEKLSALVHQHIKEDVENFATLRTESKWSRDAMLQAAAQMQALTSRVDAAFTRSRGG